MSTQNDSLWSRIRAVAEPLALTIAGAIALGWVGIWNGYPLLAGDSAGYITSAFEGTIEARRPSFYPMLIAALSWRESLWPTIAFQCLLASATLFALVRILAPRSQAATFMLVIATTASLTPLPWFTARIMPDVFVGIMGVAVCLVVACPEQPTSRLARSLLLTVIGIGVACHVANLFIIMIGLLLGLVGRHLLGSTLRPALRPTVIVLFVAMVSTVAVCGVNWWANGAFALTTESHAWTMARMVRFGIVQQLLDDRCGHTAYALCPYRDRLSTEPDHFMFSTASPLRELGGAEGSRDALRPIIEDANAHYAGMQAAAALRAAVEQFGMVYLKMGLGTHRQPGLSGPPAVIKQYLPNEYDAYEAGRQRSGTLHVESFNAVIVPVAWVSIAGAVGLVLVGWFRRDRAIASVALFFILWITGNAVVMGVLNAPFDRYQARIVWLMPAALAVAIGRASRRLLASREQAATAL